MAVVFLGNIFVPVSDGGLVDRQVMVVRFVQSMNTLCPMVFTFFGITTEVRLLHPLNSSHSSDVMF